ncbi:HAD-like domain-containing protein [Mrakia frigida]|uniref:HAD-like domain-containing protein n=1 Tax=Mrakia frigida TaxID=29902 RepID=UPI003FCC08DF
MTVSEFQAEGVLFEMDGTLTDSIAAVEAAWGQVARELGLPEDEVIAATHGKRAIDNLGSYKPHIKAHEMDAEVEKFEKTILDFADSYQKRRASSFSSSASTSSNLTSGYDSSNSSVPSSRRSSMHEQGFSSRFSMSHLSKEIKEEEVDSAFEEAWDAEEDAVDMSVRILPGVREMIDSLPVGTYAVATSGAKTYAHGAMTRVGITPPKVTITADDPRLERGKPFPDPFLLAAKELGIPCKDTVIFEDSPSGIRAAVASGATVIAVCTSHAREKIADCGADYIVENMEKVHVKTLPSGRLSFSVDA